MQIHFILLILHKIFSKAKQNKENAWAGLSLWKKPNQGIGLKMSFHNYQMVTPFNTMQYYKYMLMTYLKKSDLQYRGFCESRPLFCKQQRWHLETWFWRDFRDHTRDPWFLPSLYHYTPRDWFHSLGSGSVHPSLSYFLGLPRQLQISVSSR